MKRLYFMAIIIIILITVFFILFYDDAENMSRKFLSSFDIVTDNKPVSAENFIIPSEFDKAYDDYNLMQLECGLDIAPYKGMKAVRYTYKVLNSDYFGTKNVYANVICVKNKPIAGDILSPALDGFSVPLNFFQDIK